MAFPSDGNLDAALAVTRFGLGARPGEIAEAAHDPREFLHAQIRPQGADQPQDFTSIVLKSTTEKLARPIRALAAFTQGAGARGAAAQNRAALRAALADPATRRKLAQARNQPMQDEFLARAQLAAQTPAGFRERWALFWFKHFTVSVTTGRHWRRQSSSKIAIPRRPWICGRCSRPFSLSRWVLVVPRWIVSCFRTARMSGRSQDSSPGPGRNQTNFPLHS